MASLSDLSARNRIFMSTYRYRPLDPVPFTRPDRPLSRARVAVVTTAGFHLPEQPPFDETFKGGDFSFREIEAGADLATLRIAHKSDAFDPAGLAADRNLAFPLDRLREMVAAGEIGGLNRRHLSFMGSITAPARLVADSAPRAAGFFAEDGVDVALLVPL